MTKLLLEIPTQKDLDFLLPLLERLQIRFSSLESAVANPLSFDLSEAEIEALERITAAFEDGTDPGVEAFAHMKKLRASYAA